MRSKNSTQQESDGAVYVNAELSGAVKKDPDKMGFKEALGYGFGDLGNLMNLTLVSSYLKVYCTDYLLKGKALGKKITDDISNMVLFVRLWDVINDPIWGLFVDRRSPAKSGKFRHYLASVSFPLALSLIICFLPIRQLFPNASYTVLLVFSYLSYIFYGMMYTGMNIPYGSLATAMTSKGEERTLLSTTRNIGGGLGGGIVSLLGPILLYDKNDAGERSLFNNSHAFTFAVVMAVLGVIAYLLCYKTTKERVQYAEKKEKLDLRLTYGSLFKSRPFITVTLAGMMISGLLQYQSFNQYLTKNYFADSTLSIYITASTYLPMVILILLMPKIAKRFGKKEVTTAGLAIATFFSLVLCLIGPNEQLRTHYMPFIITNFGVGAGYSFLSILTWAIVGDVIDYQEVKTGIKNESAIYAVYTFSRKLGQTIADFGGLKLLGSYAGYDAEMIEKNKLAYIAPMGDKIYKMVSRGMLIAYGITFVLFLFYPLNKKKLADMQEELTVIRQQRMEALGEANAEAEVN